MKVIIKVLSVSLAILAIVAGCKTKEIIKYNDRYIHDTTTIYNTRVDSLRLVDSVVIKAVSDTIFVEKYKFRDRWRSVHDSIYLSKVDTIRIVDKEVISKKETATSQFLKGSGVILWVLILCFILGFVANKMIAKR